MSYPNEAYFFVSKTNTALAQRLEADLKIAQQDGSSCELFNTIPHFRWGMEELNNNHRRLLKLIALPSLPEAITQEIKLSPR